MLIWLQFKGLTRLITGGSLLAFKGSLNELSSVTNTIVSSKSAKLGAQNETLIIKDIPGAISPITLLGYFTFLIVKLSLLYIRLIYLSYLKKRIKCTWLEG